MGSLGVVVNAFLLRSDPDHNYTLPKRPIKTYNRLGVINSTTVIIGLGYSIGLMLVIYRSKPFKESIISNWIVSVWIIFMFASTLAFLFSNEAGEAIQLVDMDSEW
jgi:hypothetical protein